LILPFPAGDRDVGAWESSGNNIDSPSPFGPVECRNVIPNGESWEHPVPLSGKQYPPRIVLDFDGTNASPSQEMAPEDTSSRPSK
jgi:hypothetical protein